MKLFAFIFALHASAARCAELSPSVIQFESADLIETARGTLPARELQLGDVVRLSGEQFEVEGLAKPTPVSLKDFTIAGPRRKSVFVTGCLAALVLVVQPGSPDIVACGAVLLFGLMALDHLCDAVTRESGLIQIRLDRPRPI